MAECEFINVQSKNNKKFNFRTHTFVAFHFKDFPLVESVWCVPYLKIKAGGYHFKQTRVLLFQTNQSVDFIFCITA